MAAYFSEPGKPFRIAHLSDPHLGPLPHVSLRELLNKRLTGWINWQRGRGAVHDMPTLKALVADIHAQEPDHIVCTGDLCNLGLPKEWEVARRFLDELGKPNKVSFVPGNHDAYLPSSLDGLMKAVQPFATGDDGIERFPYVRKRGPVAFVGLSSAIATPPFFASGTLGPEQLQAAETILRDLKAESFCRIVLIHHPPHIAGAKPRRALTDASALEAVLARTGAELVLYGHNHKASSDRLTGPNGTIPILGAPSASSNDRRIARPAAYHLLTVSNNDRCIRIDVELRGLNETGTIGLIRAFSV